VLRRVRAEDEKSGLTAARLSALSVLVFGGPCSLGELAAAEQVKPPTMSSIVTGLERDGLARRTRDPDDARSVRIAATPKGVRLAQRARERRIEALTRLLEPLGGHEVETIGRAADLLERALRESTA
jgi:DNA-binding MarR family transcriptional regulator